MKAVVARSFANALPRLAAPLACRAQAVVQTRFHRSGPSPSELPPKLFAAKDDHVPLDGIDHIEIYCSNAKQSAHWYQTVMGFQPVAYSGLETGNKSTASHVMQQGNIRIVLTAPLHAASDIGAHVSKHGDGVKHVALSVSDSRKAFAETVKRGAEIAFEPREFQDEQGVIVESGIKAYGDTVKKFVERKSYNGVFAPGFRPAFPSVKSDAFPPVGLQVIDHMVANVGWGEMAQWCQWYEKILGFANLVSFDDKDISTEYTSLMSKVMTNGSGFVKFPVNEPAHGRKKSQIEEYLDFYHGPGIQHIAVATPDIIKTVSELRSRGCEFLYVPGTYYDTVEDRVGKIEEDLSVLKELGILVDADDKGYMLQIFTKPVGDRPTLFFEIIQRKGSQSFGKGNFKSLFEAIEEEQRKRGTL
uniref:4-hydroxyphenylpyruvate dioxygenase n=1 Tax=Chromera velia CCMP2878 TaxID=1169474 RepID=A0A0G4HXT3_9ALVE|eukprot:Cvel_9339.t1-p1 / transcript=Cvel_9339.t1 / gene=Cvel_9339 / organism=Chromera_velia_CCMP2878 / gene_product=4-hydroxyphenylpyruvate dioxygenase, putative / transcript_product=4-hydroxyphenylpyruvate dioxygenase, putative / location=Cvel_scaffold536:23042-27611(+) / protein_length=415 / sequence_SO=supercontig / SO=protein_coding / is_pseudo=false